MMVTNQLVIYSQVKSKLDLSFDFSTKRPSLSGNPCMGPAQSGMQQIEVAAVSSRIMTSLICICQQPNELRSLACMGMR
jgi:hypothetical protein